MAKKETEHTLLAATRKVMKVRIEHELKGVVFKHSNYVTAGIPDITTTLWRSTIWWEFKHADPKVSGTKLQLLTTRRLAEAGDCYIVVYRGNGVDIVSPSNMSDDWTYTVAERMDGPNFHQALVLAMIQKHRDIEESYI